LSLKSVITNTLVEVNCQNGLLHFFSPKRLVRGSAVSVRRFQSDSTSTCMSLVFRSSLPTVSMSCITKVCD